MSLTRLSSNVVFLPEQAKNRLLLEAFLKPELLSQIVGKNLQKALDVSSMMEEENSQDSFKPQLAENELSVEILSNAFMATFREIICQVFYFLEAKGKKLDLSDLALIKELVLGVVKVNSESGVGYIDSIAQIMDWDIFMETIFYEVNLMKRPNGLTSLEAVHALVEDAIVAGKTASEAQMDMDNYQNEVIAKLNEAEGINLYIRAEIRGALNTFDKEVFPALLSSWSRAEDFLEFLMSEMIDIASREYDSFESLVKSSDDFEGRVVHDLQRYNRLLEKHGPEIKKFFEQNTALKPGLGLVSLWKAIYTFWLSAQVDSMAKQNKEMFGGGLETNGGRVLN